MLHGRCLRVLNQSPAYTPKVRSPQPFNRGVTMNHLRKKYCRSTVFIAIIFAGIASPSAWAQDASRGDRTTGGAEAGLTSEVTPGAANLPGSGNAPSMSGTSGTSGASPAGATSAGESQGAGGKMCNCPCACGSSGASPSGASSDTSTPGGMMNGDRGTSGTSGASGTSVTPSGNSGAPGSSGGSSQGPSGGGHQGGGMMR